MQFVVIPRGRDTSLTRELTKYGRGFWLSLPPQGLPFFDIAVYLCHAGGGTAHLRFG